MESQSLKKVWISATFLGFLICLFCVSKMHSLENQSSILHDSSLPQGVSVNLNMKSHNLLYQTNTNGVTDVSLYTSRRRHRLRKRYLDILQPFRTIGKVTLITGLTIFHDALAPVKALTRVTSCLLNVASIVSFTPFVAFAAMTGVLSAINFGWEYRSLPEVGLLGEFSNGLQSIAIGGAPVRENMAASTISILLMTYTAIVSIFLFPFAVISLFPPKLFSIMAVKVLYNVDTSITDTIYELSGIPNLNVPGRGGYDIRRSLTTGSMDSAVGETVMSTRAGVKRHLKSKSEREDSQTFSLNFLELEQNPQSGVEETIRRPGDGTIKLVIGPDGNWRTLGFMSQIIDTTQKNEKVPTLINDFQLRPEVGHDQYDPSLSPSRHTIRPGVHFRRIETELFSPPGSSSSLPSLDDGNIPGYLSHY